MTEPKLCPKTLRWAAQHIRKFKSPQSAWAEHPHLAYESCAYETAAKSMDNWATETEMAAAKRKAEEVHDVQHIPAGPDRPTGVFIRGPALTVDQDSTDEHYGRIAFEAFAKSHEDWRKAHGLEPYSTMEWSKLDDLVWADWVAAAKAVCMEMAKAWAASQGIKPKAT